MLCVGCGKQNADKGSLKHPYCVNCFTEVWHDDYKKYNEWLVNEHDF